MKKIMAIISIIVVSAWAVMPAATASGGLQHALDIINGKSEETNGTESDVDAYLVSTEDFMYYFNFYSAFIGDGHELSIDKAFDYEKIGDRILFKTIYNDCEILSLWLSDDALEVESISCTWAKNVRGAGDYLNDFLQMLMEALLACGMESDSVSSVFTSFGEKNAFNVGDADELTIDGITVSYEVTSYSGVSFVIEREQ